MSEQSELGILGEELAAKFLEKKDYKIHVRNWRFKKGELDIVAEKNNTMVFVEVKTRKSSYLAEPRVTISLKKQKILIATADIYLKLNKISKESQFDVITVIVGKKENTYEHLEDAFYPTM
ncbi:MAG: YraN family protein [Bacteroidia bacterium]|nr:YraN family protein [Bacteroidia bacterium]